MAETDFEYSRTGRNSFDGSPESMQRYAEETAANRLSDRAEIVARLTRPLLPQCKEEGLRRGGGDHIYICVTEAMDVVDVLQLALSPDWSPDGYDGNLWVHTVDLPNPDPKLFKDDHWIDKGAVELQQRDTCPSLGFPTLILSGVSSMPSFATKLCHSKVTYSALRRRHHPDGGFDSGFRLARLGPGDHVASRRPRASHRSTCGSLSAAPGRRRIF